MLGDNSFVWCTDDALEAHHADSSACEAYADALACVAKTKRGGSRLGAQAQRALTELASPASFVAPWSYNSDSEADEAATVAAAAVAAAQQTRAADADAVATALAETTARDGLTPDWLIDVGCDIFSLTRPSVEQPVIVGLVDPCTNNKRFPNIPAERLYDRHDDGLAIRNSWAGNYCILNPPYEAAVQWRFINRAINEVEWGRCPGILIICRNSTDTGYFQRLRPFPRCYLRRDAIRFKDYPDKTPIAFGICAFVLCRDPDKQADIYPRFVDAFANRGEVALPIDAPFVRSLACQQLLVRLHAESTASQRDSWVCCDACGRWRSLPHGTDVSALADVAWTCREQYPATGCEQPLSKREMKAFFYTAKEAAQYTALAPSAAEDQFPVPGHIDSRTLAALDDVTTQLREAQQRHDEALAKALQGAELRRRGLRSHDTDESAQVRSIGAAVALPPVGSPTSQGAGMSPFSTFRSAAQLPAHHHQHRRSSVDGGASSMSGAAASQQHGSADQPPQEELAAATFLSLTPFERQRLERIAANQERLASLLRPTPETPVEAAARREQHASAAAAAARRVRDEAESRAAQAAAAAGYAAVQASTAHAAAVEAAHRVSVAALARDAAVEAAQRARDDLAAAMAKHAAAVQECDAARAAEEPGGTAMAVDGAGSSEK